MTWLRKLAGAWLASWVFLLWTAFCVSLGAAVMLAAIVVSLEQNGIHVTADLRRAFAEHISCSLLCATKRAGVSARNTALPF